MKVVCHFLLPWAIEDISGEHWLSGLGGLVPGADGTSLDVVGNVGIYARAVH